MFTVLVLFREQGQLQFLFEHHDHAQRAFKTLTDQDQIHRACLTQVMVADDYGTEAQIELVEIRAVLMQDLQRVLVGSAEYRFAETKAQAAMQKRAMSDPTLRILTANGPMPGLQHS